MILNIHHETCRMSQIYQQAYDMLAPGLKPTFDLWVAEARRIPGGEDIVLNISSEMHLSPSVLNDFLTSISTCFLMEGHNPGSAERAYVKACNNLLNTGNQMLCCLGPQAQTDSSIRVHRIILLEKLQLMISEAMKKTSSIRNEQQEDWDNFQELVDEGDLEGCLEILSKAIPCKPDRTNWVYFNEDQSDVDPLAGVSSELCLDMLGLPQEWNPRGKDQSDPKSSWRIHYRFKQITRHIPTIADTIPSKWNPYFQPSQDSRWGWTRPIGSPRGTSEMPEVVHRGWEPGIELGAISDIPEFLG
jgi:hypothetical protein